jgi:hypothetical protein
LQRDIPPGLAAAPAANILVRFRELIPTCPASLPLGESHVEFQSKKAKRALNAGLYGHLVPQMQMARSKEITGQVQFT